MSIYTSNDESFQTDTDAYYEEIASQEAVYLEATEEGLRAMLSSNGQVLSQTTEHWRSTIEEIELDWEQRDHGSCK